MNMPNLFKRQKSLDEIEEENDRKEALLHGEDLNLSLAERRAKIIMLNQKLKPHGLSMKTFAGNIKGAIDWLSKH
jgi:hypothetical protein